MKQIYESNGYKAYELKIEGYDCQLFETPDKYYSIRVPFGDTPKEKEMFDKLVYYNKGLYHGKNQNEVIAKVAEFIRDNRKTK